MSVGYRCVQWNANKIRYDLIAVGGVVAYLAAFVGLGLVVHTGERAISPPILLMRAFGTAAILMLHLILCIGPLCRLNPRFLPILYNRRHLGVLTFLLGLGHAVLVVAFYHGFGEISAPLSLLISNTQVNSATGFPFEWFGIFALLVLFLMAATSHDFWLANLHARYWKWLHMMVYPAYAALVLHVSLGALQTERSPTYAVLMGLGVLIVSGLHLAAGRKETREDQQGVHATQQATTESDAGNWIDVCAVFETRPDHGKVVKVSGGERISLFRVGDKLSAVSNVCAHQGGPLGEGRVINGCITCPWHGYQYRAHDGCAPPPFTEKIATYRVRIAGDRVQVDRTPLPPGTPVDPATILPSMPAEPQLEPSHA